VLAAVSEINGQDAAVQAHMVDEHAVGIHPPQTGLKYRF
jgi:hypothetical protein